MMSPKSRAMRAGPTNAGLIETASEKSSHLRVKPSYHHGELRESLVAAATTLVRELGPERFSMADACRVSGVSKAAPYRHFTNKHSLLSAVGDEGFARLKARLQAAIEGYTLGSNLRISSFGVAYIDFAIDEPEIFKLMFGNTHPKPVDSCANENAQRVFEMLLEEITARIRHRERELLMRVVRPLWSIVHGASMLTIDNAYLEIDPDWNVKMMVPETTALILAPYPEPM